MHALLFPSKVLCGIHAGAHPTDVRMTTRFKEHDLTEGLTGAIHETGHSLYEQVSLYSLSCLLDHAWLVQWYSPEHGKPRDVNRTFSNSECNVYCETAALAARPTPILPSPVLV